MNTTTSRLLVTGLIISVAVNIYALTQKSSTARVVQEPGRKQISAIINNLPQDKQTEVMSQVQDNNEKINANAKQVRELRQSLVPLLQSKQFDAKAVSERLEQIRLVNIDSQAQIHDVFVTALSKMSLNERTAVADRMLRNKISMGGVNSEERKAEPVDRRQARKEKRERRRGQRGTQQETVDELQEEEPEGN